MIDFMSNERENNHYFSRFGVDAAVIRQIMEVALSKGGDYCDLFFQQEFSNHVGLEDREVNRAYSNIDLGLGIRVLKGDQTGYSFTEDLSLKSMKLAARTAAAIANDSRKIPPQEFSTGKKGDYYALQVAWENVGIANKIGFLEKVNEMVYQKDSRIIKATLSFYDENSYILIATSDGVLQTDHQPMTGLNVSCIAEQNNRRESNYYGLSVRDDVHFFTPERLDELAHESVRYTVQLFDAVKPEPGEMEVVLAAGSSGILLHEAIGHGMEADFNRKNVSIFADKMGKRVAKDFVSIVDDGTNPHLRGSINIDDEGNPVEKTMLVENGILKSYLHNRISANFYGVKPTGNGRRESFRHPPIPRMRNTYMLPGPHKKEEIIQSVKKGILAETFSNGQVYIGAGDFTFYVKSGYLIENGQITRPIKDVNIIGNGPKVLENIVMVADDLEMAKGGWTCGKNGQGVPVSQGLPTVKVSAITVGGVS
ncbi:TldD/PmbA family protein [candidate division KSB1 bacterium]|nr:TldD/PmbA family protein [candidate division KSB1 bacterium]